MLTDNMYKAYDLAESLPTVKEKSISDLTRYSLASSFKTNIRNKKDVPLVNLSLSVSTSLSPASGAYSVRLMTDCLHIWSIYTKDRQ